MVSKPLLSLLSGFVLCFMAQAQSPTAPPGTPQYKSGVQICGTASGQQILLDLTSEDFDYSGTVSSTVTCLSAPAVETASQLSIYFELASTEYTSSHVTMPSGWVSACSPTTSMSALLMFHPYNGGSTTAYCLSLNALGATYTASVTCLLSATPGSSITCGGGTTEYWMSYPKDRRASAVGFLSSLGFTNTNGDGYASDPYSWNNITGISEFITYDGTVPWLAADFTTFISEYFPPVYTAFANLGIISVVSPVFGPLRCSDFPLIGDTLPVQLFRCGTMLPGSQALTPSILGCAQSRRRSSARYLGYAFPAVGLIMMNHAIEKSLKHITQAINSLATLVQSIDATLEFFEQSSTMISLSKPLLLSFSDNIELVLVYSQLALQDSNLWYSVASSWLPGQVVRVNGSYYNVSSPPPLIVLTPVAVCDVYSDGVQSYASTGVSGSVSTCPVTGNAERSYGCITSTCTDGTLTVTETCMTFGSTFSDPLFAQLISDASTISSFHGSLMPEIDQIQKNLTDNYNGLGSLGGITSALSSALKSIESDVSGLLSPFGHGSLMSFVYIMIYLIIFILGAYAIYKLVSIALSPAHRQSPG